MPAVPSTSGGPRPLATSEGREVADIHQRLDAITQQIEQLSRPDALAREQGVARQLNDAISRLDARLSQISRSPPAMPNPLLMRARAASEAPGSGYRDSPPLSPTSLDATVAEIAARQNELESAAKRHVPPRLSSPPPPKTDFSSLEQHLVKITDQIEAMRRPEAQEEVTTSLRHELAQISQAITEAMPRRAIESLEGEIRSLHHRIDETRCSSADKMALAGVERTLAEIREVLGSLTPAEQLIGFDKAIRSLDAKLELMLRSRDDPSLKDKLEAALGALRAIVANVASNEALAQLADDVRLLSVKVDQIGGSTSGNDRFFTLLEDRIATLASAMENREQPFAREGAERLESAIHALSERFDNMGVGTDQAATLADLEQRISCLLERLDTFSAPHNNELSRVESGLQEILQYLERQQAQLASLSDRSTGTGMADLVKRELSELRHSQAETDRQTQNSIEAVNSALGHMVGRLRSIEDNLHSARSAAEARQADASLPRFDRADTAHAHIPSPAMPPAPSMPPPPFHAIAEVLEPHTSKAPPALTKPPPALTKPPPAMTQAPPATTKAPPAMTKAPPAMTRAPAIAPDLPPDHPLEPGTRPAGRAASSSERIAASESALGDLALQASEPISSANFIAAARRAAQVAASQSEPPARPRTERGNPKPAKSSVPDPAEPPETEESTSTATSKIRSLLIGTSVVAVLLGFKLTMSLLDGGSTAPAIDSTASFPAAQTQSVAESRPHGTGDQLALSSAPTPITRPAAAASAPSPRNGTATMANSGAAAFDDITGTIVPADAIHPDMPRAAPGETLPETIGGPLLRNAALQGDPTAAFEIGVRFAEGKGVAVNYTEAARWYDRAARAGLAPASFRLGALYEKGLGVTRDLDSARLNYSRAAERGNAKAMHNLAVLNAEGGNRNPDYKGSAQWFRKAADHGLADSQFNLGILYARGIGVETNLAESYKWFSLAAAQGDADATAKRDDIARRLDPQSLAAAKLAIQTFTVEPQPDDAVTVPAPVGGWDSTQNPTRSSEAPPAAPVARPLRTPGAAR